ncbi:hypothetical protein [Roseivivax sp. CAU 1761]
MTYNKYDINGPLEYAKKLAAALRVPQTMKDLVEKDVEGTRFTADSLYREWVNDVLSRPLHDATREAAMQKPELQFYRYAEMRAKEPHAPSPRCVRKLLDRYGVDIVAPIREHLWERQIEWARALQAHCDDDVVLNAKYFLREATGEHCDKAFEGLIRYQQERSEPATYEERRRLDEIEESIGDIDIDELEFFPTCIEYMRAKRSEKPSTMTEKMKRQVAAGIRKQYEIDRKADAIHAHRTWFTRNPLYLESYIAVEAARMGLGSDDLVIVQEEFLASFEREGPPEGKDTPAARFMSLMNAYQRAGRTAPVVSEQEASHRKAEIASLGGTRRRALNQNHVDVEGDNPKRLAEWKGEVLNDIRPASREWALDYYLFLISSAIT